MKLYLLRHAHPEPGGQHDAGRPLSVLGQDQARLAGSMLATLPQPPAAILTSPYLRARQTAVIAADALRLPAPGVTEYLSLDSDQRQILALINTVGTAPLLLVGHEPHLRELASLFIDGDRRQRVPIGYATVVSLDLPSPAAWGTGRVEWIKHVDEMEG